MSKQSTKLSDIATDFALHGFNLEALEDEIADRVAEKVSKRLSKELRSIKADNKWFEESAHFQCQNSREKLFNPLAGP